MSKYLLYLDETGGFAFGHRSSYVGGLGGSKDVIDKFKSSIIQKFNEYWQILIKSDDMQGHVAKYSEASFWDFFHFADLNMRIDNDKEVKPHFLSLSPLEAENIILLFEEILNKYSVDVFYASGLKEIYGGPQDMYLYQLNGALIGMLDRVRENGFENIEITVATRNLSEIIGSRYTKNLEKEIQSNYQITLQSQIARRYGKNINILFKTLNSDTKNLILADMALGIARYRFNELGFSKVIKIETKKIIQEMIPYPTLEEKYLIGVKNTKKNQVLQNEVFVLFDLLEIKKTTIEKSFKLFEELNGLDNKSIRELDDYLENRLIDLYNEIKYSDQNLMMSIIEKIISYKEPPRIIILNKTFRTAYRMLFELEVHSGKQISKYWHQFDEFLKSKQHDLFTSPLAYYEEYLSAKLVLTQTLFNKNEFQLVEDFLKDDLKIWKNLRKALPDQFLGADLTAAKLAGTLGQTYIFLGDLQNNDQTYFDLGYEYLCDDLNFLNPNMDGFSQGFNYLISFYWLRGNFKGAMEAYKKYSYSLNDVSIFEFMNAGSKDYPNIIIDKKSRYSFLNQLRLVALEVENGKKLSELNLGKLIKISYLLIENGHNYPNFLIQKWIIYLLLLHSIEIPTNLKDHINSIQWQKEEPLIELMGSILYFLIDEKAKWKYYLENIEDLCRNDGNKQFLVSRKDLIKSMISGEAPISKIMRFLPYYYS